MESKKQKFLTKQQLIIELWRQLDGASVGQREVLEIQQALLDTFGAQESPASIARTLADQGAHLLHTEILDADVNWRERQMLGAFAPEELNFGTLAAASAWVEKVGTLYRELERERNTAGLNQLRQLVLQIKSELKLVAASKKAGSRVLAEEVAQWLTIWLQDPQIFADWLSLRRLSAEFRERFDD
jgi:hypothetical protein